MLQQIPDYEVRSHREPQPATSPLRFCIAIIGLGVALNLLTVLMCFADMAPTSRGGIRGLGAAAVALGISPVLNGVFMLISLAAAVVMKFSDSRTPCVLVAVVTPIVGAVINVVVLVSILPQNAPGIWEGAH